MICNTDKDCDNNNICSFNPDDLKHYCINNEIEKLYMGCIKDDSYINNFETVESKSINSSDYMKCIDFGRRQINKDGMEYNYMVFKPKKDVYVDTTTINIYLKCDGLLIAVIPYEDFFDINCENDQTNCTLLSKKSLLNFIIQNTQNCLGKNIYLEVIHECENEKVKNIQNIPININSNESIKIELKCPIEIDKYKPTCQAVFIDNNGLENNNVIDNNTKIYECQKPIYKLPVIVNNVDNYKRLKKKQSSIELKKYDTQINEKINDLKKLEAEKYMRLKTIQTGENISYETAYKIIDKYSISKLINSSTNNWNIFKNYDAAQNLYDLNEKDNFLTYYGKVYTLQDALKVVNDNNQNFFVWYHNSFEFNDYASKLFFIDIFYVDDKLLTKSNWVRTDNVTTGLIKFDLEHFEDQESNNIQEYTTQLKNIANNNNNTNSIHEESHNLFNTYASTTKNVYNVIIDTLNRKITTLGQAVSMSNYETNINNKILFILSWITGILFIICLIVFIYYNYIVSKTDSKLFRF